MTQYAYHDYVLTLSQRVKESFSSIIAEHNFELGSEAETALCQVLRSALPDRFGIARGYIVTFDGQTGGDDLVVFERSRFPTLALRERDDFSRKEYIPAEAAYCYIEAKHTVNIEGNDEQSLEHACKKISKVKEICKNRKSVSLMDIGPNIKIGSNLSVTVPLGYPPTRNPMVGVLFARQVRQKKGRAALLSDPAEIEEMLKQHTWSAPIPPDIMVIGENNVVLPVRMENGEYRFSYPFLLPGCHLVVYQAKGIAFGLGLMSIMACLDWIELGTLPWLNMIGNALGFKSEPTGDR